MKQKAFLKCFFLLLQKHSNKGFTNANDMLKKIITSMNAIIRNQVNERTCVQLRPDLQRFVDNIIEFRSLQQQRQSPSPTDVPESIGLERYTSSKFKRSVHFRKAHQFPDDRRPFVVCTSQEIREKFRTISGLTRAFERMTASNRLRATDWNVYVQRHLRQLDDLQSFVRDRRQTEANPGRHIGASKRQLYDEQTSGKYEVLVRTAEFIRKNALLGGKLGELQDEDDYIAFENSNYDI